MVFVQSQLSSVFLSVLSSVVFRKQREATWDRMHLLEHDDMNSMQDIKMGHVVNVKISKCTLVSQFHSGKGLQNVPVTETHTFVS